MRASYLASYFDTGDRLTDSVDVGTNGGVAYVRPSTVPGRSDAVLVTSQTFSPAGWVQDVLDPRGLDTRNVYDNLGRTVETIQNYTDGIPTSASNRTTAFTFDGNDNTLSVQAVLPGGSVQTTAYVYGVTTTAGSAFNSNDLLAATIYPDPSTGAPSTDSNQQETYTWNALGQVVTMTDRNGTTHEYKYDVLGRQTSDTVTILGTGVDPSVRRIDTAYDSQGNVFLFTSYADVDGTTIVNQVLRQFNGLGQLIAEYQSHSEAVDTSTTPSVQYVYSEMAGGANHSRLVSMVYPNGRELDYNYASGLDDSISRLSSISDNSGTLEAYSYLGLGTVVRRAHPEPGIDQTFIKLSGELNGDAGDRYIGLDRFGRVVDQRWVNSVTAVQTDRFQYTFDRDSNALTKNNALYAAFDEAFTYDGFNQLATFARDSHTQSFGLDTLGNFNSVTTDGGTPVTRTLNAQNQYVNVGSGTAAYDKNGNLTTDPITGYTQVYDAWNRLVAVKNGGTTLASYNFDAMNRRSVEVNGSNTRDVFFDGPNTIEERLNGSSSASMQYVWDPLASNTLVEIDQGSNRYYVQQDVNGNVTALVNTSATVVERYAYDPYGLQTVYDGSMNVRSGGTQYDMRIGFQGMRLDLATGLYHTDTRDYSPQMQVWLEVDWSRFAGGTFVLTQFVGDNPVNRTDPRGLAWGLGELVGGGIGYGEALTLGGALELTALSAGSAALIFGTALFIDAAYDFYAASKKGHELDYELQARPSADAVGQLQRAANAVEQDRRRAKEREKTKETEKRKCRCKNPEHYNIDTSNATDEERKSILAYATRSNIWLAENGPVVVQRVSGTPLQAQKNAAAKREVDRAKGAGTPYKGQAGHVPDTAISGMAEPPMGWLDMPGKANSIAGGGLAAKVDKCIDFITVNGKLPAKLFLD